MIDKIEFFIKKLKERSSDSDNPLDVSTDHDLCIGVMNLIAIEEHLFFTGAKTEKTSYYDMINEIRDMRKELLKMIIKDSEGEVWCTSKHLLSSSMRMMEVGTKCQTLGKNEDAYRFFEKSYKLYTMFWGLNMKFVDFDQVKSEIKIIDNDSHQQIKNSTEEQLDNISKDTSKDSKFSSNLRKWKDFISQKFDCCRE